MARIIGLKEKQGALKDIQAYLRTLSSLNSFIVAPNPTEEYIISFDTHKVSFTCSDKSKIDALILAFKETIVKNITSLAQKYEIELDDDDRALMQIVSAEVIKE